MPLIDDEMQTLKLIHIDWMGTAFWVTRPTFIWFYYILNLAEIEAA